MHRRPRVALDVVLTAPLRRRQARRLARTLEHAVERVGELGRRPRVLERLAGSLRVAGFERAAHLLEHRGELGQRRLDCAAQCRDRVAGHGDQHGEPHAAADERVDEPVGPGAGARERGDQDGRRARLRGDQRTASQEDDGHRCEQHHDGDLHGACADPADQEVGHADSDRHADCDLRRPARVPAGRDAEHDDRGDRSEERVAVTDQIVRDEPRDPGGRRGLDDQDRGRAQRKAPLPEPRARLVERPRDHIGRAASQRSSVTGLLSVPTPLTVMSTTSPSRR